ncbi:MAG: hypothetical protein AAF799_32075 [Myxococcota bacterium]
MPSVLHQLLVELFGESPQDLLATVMRDLGLPETSTLTFTRSEASFSQQVELEADLVLLVRGEENEPLCLLIVEIQLSVDRDKESSWPAYQAEGHRRYRCPSFVIVVALDPKVAGWATGPFCTGQTTFHPLVLGPRDVPRVTQIGARTSAEMALFSGLAHGADPEVRRIGRVLQQLLIDQQPPRADVYWDVFLRAIDERTRNEFMLGFDWYTPQSEWGKRIYAQGLTEGRLEGERDALQRILEARGLEIDEEHAAQLEACASGDQIHDWIRRAITASSIDQVFPS